MASKPSERFVWAVDTLALDPADRVLEVGCGLKTAALEQADFGDEQFDKVFAFNVAPFWHQPKEALGIVRRHLAEGFQNAGSVGRAGGALAIALV